MERYQQLDPSSLLKELSGPYAYTAVHIRCLYGIQPMSEYSKRKKLAVEEEYKERGISFLLDFPIIVMALPRFSLVDYSNLDVFSCLLPNEPYSLAIHDGHHRVRSGPKFDIRVFPSIILTPYQTAQAYKSGDVMGTLSKVDGWINETLKSFDTADVGLGFRSEVTFQFDSIGKVTVNPLSIHRQVSHSQHFTL